VISLLKTSLAAGIASNFFVPFFVFLFIKDVFLFCKVIDLFGNSERFIGPMQIIFRHCNSSLPNGSPWAEHLPSFLLAPLPIMVLEIMSTGLPLFLMQY